MTIRKQYTPRNYETFADDDTSSPASQQADSDKSRSAAVEAQRLGSQGSWADNLGGGTPATTMTPAASTVDADEVREVQYPRRPNELFDPPPVYTPSDTTNPHSQSPAAPASPVVSRSAPAPPPEPVSAPVPVPPSSQSLSQRPFHDRDEEEGTRLLEPAPHPHEVDPDSVPVFLQSAEQEPSRGAWYGGRHRGAGRGCGRGAGRRTGCGGRWGRGRGAGCDKERARRFKRTCWFVCALLLCLWLMIPALCKSLANDRHTQFPNLGSRPSSSPWPPAKREHRDHETSHSISGTYQLYDLLDLSTVSGSIGITVEVQPGEKPAVLRLSSVAGSISIRMISGGGLFHAPSLSEATRTRVLMTEISCQSGSVSGDVVHGNGGSTIISSRSGSISVTIYTTGVTEQDPPSSLSVSTNSGSQNIKVLAPLASTEAVRAIEASHTVLGSGSMNIRYPNTWEGVVHARGQGMGSISASGRGLVVQKEGRNELYGYRGMKGGSRIEVLEQGSGSVRFQC